MPQQIIVKKQAKKTKNQLQETSRKFTKADASRSIEKTARSMATSQKSGIIDIIETE